MQNAYDLHYVPCSAPQALHDLETDELLYLFASSSGGVDLHLLPESLVVPKGAVELGCRACMAWGAAACFAFGLVSLRGRSQIVVVRGAVAPRPMS
eukprot:8209111-Pyramimonas_sp.AAC.1